MKTIDQTAQKKARVVQNATGVSFCGKNALTCAGRTFTPDADLAFVEFHLCYAFPAAITEKTAIWPQVIANSYQSMEGKVFNLNHIMRSYDPEENPRDYILGSIEAVEFPAMPEGGWSITTPENAPSIRAVASMFKAAQQVESILEDWFAGRTPLGDGQWTVSMENSHRISDCGFLVRVADGPVSEGLGSGYYDVRNLLAEFIETTPAEIAALGFAYVPVEVAPLKLLECLNTEEDDARQKNICTRICRDYCGAETFLLIGGLNNRIRFNGVGLTPRGKEKPAHVSRMFASGAALLDTENIFSPLHQLADVFLKNERGQTGTSIR